MGFFSVQPAAIVARSRSAISRFMPLSGPVGFHGGGSKDKNSYTRGAEVYARRDAPPRSNSPT